ncbi:MAG: AMP-binding protein, partial [Bacteroidia bacterium]|nr:AMP-binding protein [Bacteroidia bacterium]
MEGVRMEGFDEKRFEVDFKNRTLPFLLEARAREIGEKVFFMFQDRKVTYRELDVNVNRVANSLIGLNVKKGEKVCFMMNNSLEFVYCWFALAKIAAIMVPMNPTLRGNLLQYIISNSEATVVIADNDLLDRIQFIEENIQNVNKIIIVSQNQGLNEKVEFKRIEIMYWDDLLNGSSAAPGVEVNPWDAMSILYTSGTTGPSKGAILPQHYYYDNALAAIRWMRHSEEDVIYSCLPFFHANASITGIYTAMLAKASFAMSKRFSLRSFWDEIAMYKATHTNVMGSILVLLMKQNPKPDDAKNTLKVVNSVPLIPESLEFEKRFGAKLITMYGATETSIVIASSCDEET